MRIHIRGRNLSVSAEQSAHVERRLHFALGRFGADVRSVDVAVVDVNGPRGGIDKHCRMAAGLSSGSEARVEEKADAFDAVVDGAADRLGRSVAQALERRRELRIRCARSRRPAATLSGRRTPKPRGVR